MNLPGIGFVSLQDIVIGLACFLAILSGLYHGFQGEFSGLVAALAGFFISAVPAVHKPATELCQRLAPSAAPHLGYLAVFIVAYLLVLIIVRALPKLADLNFTPWLSTILGGLFGVAKGIIFSTMFLVLLQGWRLPVETLYHQSRLGLYIIGLWQKFGLMPELSLFKYITPMHLL